MIAEATAGIRSDVSGGLPELEDLDGRHRHHPGAALARRASGRSAPWRRRPGAEALITRSNHQRLAGSSDVASRLQLAATLDIRNW